MSGPPLSWGRIARLGLVQTALGAVVVLMTATLNRVMIVELALPALAPGLMVALFHIVQILRPVWGHRSDVGGRRTPWIVAGMAALSVGGVVAALGTAHAGASGLALAALGFLLVGAGAGAAGTNVLAMLAARVAPARRAGAATLVWVMMIFGFALTAPLAGRFLDPYSPGRLVAVVAVVAGLAFLVASLAVRGVEGAAAPQAAKPRSAGFRDAFAQVWAEPQARRFTVFIFVSMLAYSAQELLIEPYAGLVFGLPPGVTTTLAGLQHGGALAGMVLVALLASRGGDLAGWTVGGCFASAAALAAIAATGLTGAGPAALRACVAALGLGNGVYAAAAIGRMMGLAGQGASGREGARMGLWGAAQALALGAGGLTGAGAVDLARAAFGAPLYAYAATFAAEGLAFLASAWLAARMGRAVAAQFQPAPGAAAALMN